jgi:prenyl protein peptidase
MPSGLSTLLSCEVNDRVPGLGTAVTYCLIVSCSFVGSIYACVPSHVRRLDRDDHRQIRWRSAAASIACVGAVVLYPIMMCRPLQLVRNESGSLKAFLLSEIIACGTAFLHITLLYMGPIALGVAIIHDCLLQQQRKTGSSSSSSDLQLRSFLCAYYGIFLEPTLSAFRRQIGSSWGGWMAWRNLVIAPVTEELVFRGCIVSALTAVSSGSSSLAPVPLSTVRVTITAPLFFGLCHVHHGVLSWRRGQSPLATAVQTMFQFAYTSLFGSYATYLFIQTRSLSAVILSHAYCNGMGLPDLSFLQPYSRFYRFRHWIMAVHVAGLLSFLGTIRVAYAR